MVTAGNKGKRLSLVNHTTETNTEVQKYRILMSARPRPNNYLELSKEDVLGNVMLSH